MNLLEITNSAGNMLDFQPTRMEYAIEFHGVVNDILFDLYTNSPYSFAQRETRIPVYADVTSSTASINIGAGFVNVILGVFEPWMEGQILQISGSTAEDGEYVIRKYVTANQVYLVGFVALSSQTNLTITIKNRYITLPKDCIQILGIGVREFGFMDNTPYGMLTRGEDHDYNLDLDATGTPHCWIPYDNRTLAPPRLAPVIADGGLLPDNVPVTGEYSVCYTFLNGNIESAPSPESEAVTITAAHGITISNIQDTGANSGILKRFYIKGPQGRSFFKSGAGEVAEATTTTSTAASLTVSYLTTNERMPEHGGEYQRIRLYPRPDENAHITIRYLYRPIRLIEDTDIPTLPIVCHAYLYLQAAEVYGIKHGMQVNRIELASRKAGMELLKIKNRFLSQETWYPVRGDWSSGRRTNRTIRVTHF